MSKGAISCPVEPPASRKVELLEKLKRVPESYAENSAKERILLEYVEDFRRQFIQLFPRRRPLLLTPPNEKKSRKFISTTIVPTQLPYADCANLEQCSGFVADFLEYIPLEDPTAWPAVVPSMASVVQMRAGDCVDFALLLCSILRGCGYDAYCVAGYAPRWVCTQDQTMLTSPLLRPTMLDEGDYCYAQAQRAAEHETEACLERHRLASTRRHRLTAPSEGAPADGKGEQDSSTSSSDSLRRYFFDKDAKQVASALVLHAAHRDMKENADEYDAVARNDKDKHDFNSYYAVGSGAAVQAASNEGGPSAEVQDVGRPTVVGRGGPRTMGAGGVGEPMAVGWSGQYAKYAHLVREPSRGDMGAISREEIESVALEAESGGSASRSSSISMSQSISATLRNHGERKVPLGVPSQPTGDRRKLLTGLLTDGRLHSMFSSLALDITTSASSRESGVLTEKDLMRSRPWAYVGGVPGGVGDLPEEIDGYRIVSRHQHTSQFLKDRKRDLRPMSSTYVPRKTKNKPEDNLLPLPTSAAVPSSQMGDTASNSRGGRGPSDGAQSPTEGGLLKSYCGPDADPLWGQRVHAWVLVQPGRSGVEAPVYIEPTTGAIYPVGRSPYLGVEQVWNEHNLWVNVQKPSEERVSQFTKWGLAVSQAIKEEQEKRKVQVPSKLNVIEREPFCAPPHKLLGDRLSSESSIMLALLGRLQGGAYCLPDPNQMSLALQDNQHWEYVLMNGSKRKRRSDPSGGLDEDFLIGAGADGNGTGNAQGGGAAELDLVDAPAPWCQALKIEPYPYKSRYPRLVKRIAYRQSVVEKFAPYSQRDGLVLRLTIFTDRSKKVPLEIRQIYAHRKDSMVSRYVYPLEQPRRIHERFAPGVESVAKAQSAAVALGLKDLIELVDTQLIFEFYPNARKDGMVRREEVVGKKVVEHFQGRDDFLTFRSVSCVAEKGRRKRQGSKRGGLGNSNRDVKKIALGRCPEQPIVKITEKFARDSSKVADRDVRKRTHFLLQDLIRLDYHYGENFITHSVQVVDKAYRGEGSGSAGSLSSNAGVVQDFRQNSSGTASSEDKKSGGGWGGRTDGSSLTREQRLLTDPTLVSSFSLDQQRYLGLDNGKNLTSSKEFATRSSVSRNGTVRVSEDFKPLHNVNEVVEERQQLLQYEKQLVRVVKEHEKIFTEEFLKLCNEKAQPGLEYDIYDRYANLWKHSGHEAYVDEFSGAGGLGAVGEDGRLAQKIDYLEPFLASYTLPLTKRDALQVKSDCLSTLKDRLVERANIIQSHLDQEIRELREHEQMSRRQLSSGGAQEGEEDYSKYYKECRFRIEILEARLRRHEQMSLAKFVEMDKRLNNDPRLRVLGLYDKDSSKQQ